MNMKEMMEIRNQNHDTHKIIADLKARAEAEKAKKEAARARFLELIAKARAAKAEKVEDKAE